MVVTETNVRMNLPAHRQRLVAAFKGALADRDVLFSLVGRELRTRYRRSALGWAWSMINPLTMTMIYSLVFSVFLKVEAPRGHPSGLQSFPVYFLCGLLPWSFFVGSVTTASNALIGSGAILNKVRFAREHVVLAPVVALFVTLGLELVVLMIVVVTQAQNPLTYLPVLVVVCALLFMFVAGVAMFLAALSVRYRDLPHIMTMVFMVWFYLTPIAYPLERVPATLSPFGVNIHPRVLILANPMTRFVQMFRNCLYELTLPGLTTFAVVAVLSFGSFLLGYRFFIRRSAALVELL
jgi:ABC-type polysaccharide/polyol phosphate export permease